METRKRLISPQRAVLMFGVIFVASVTISTISYYTLKKLTFAGASDYMREKVNKLAVPIRKQLVAEHGAQETSFINAQGFELKGFFIKHDQAECNVVLCHGYRSNKEMLSRFVDVLPFANVLMFDFPGHGQSEGDFITIGLNEYKDVIAASSHLRLLVNDTKAQELPLVILGVSMGGAAAIKAASIEPNVCDALIIDSSYADLWQVISSVFTEHTGLPRFPFLNVMEYMLQAFASVSLRSMKPIEYVKNITKPIFFVHSCIDDHTEADDTLRMYGHATTEKKKLWIGPKTKHAKLHKSCPDIYKRKIRVFLNRHVFGTWQ